MTKRVVSWVLSNVAFAACIWFGIVNEQPGPVNVLRVWIGLEFVMTTFVWLCLTTERAKDMPNPLTPRWIRTVRPWTQGAYVATFAWFGYLGLSVCYALACVMWAAIQERMARAHGVTA